MSVCLPQRLIFAKYYYLWSDFKIVDTLGIELRPNVYFSFALVGAYFLDYLQS